LLSRFGGLWRHPDFVRLWAGETVSVFGSLVGGLALQFTAVLWLDATPLQLSLLLGCQFVPGFAVGLVAGAWVDRLHRRPILIAADIGRALALLTIPLAAVFDLLTIGQLYVVALVANSLTVFFDVAYEAYLPTLVEPHELVEGNSKLTASASVAEFSAGERLAGPAVHGSGRHPGRRPVVRLVGGVRGPHSQPRTTTGAADASTSAQDREASARRRTPIRAHSR
jgi:MFS family permease